jgi:choline dehydrogenase-like flavoprotein
MAGYGASASHLFYFSTPPSVFPALASRLRETGLESESRGWSADRTAHLLGTCRMGRDPKDSIVNTDCWAHDVPNLFICDGSVFPTSTAVNPSLTIEAIAARTADRIVALARRGEPN